MTIYIYKYVSVTVGKIDSQLISVINLPLKAGSKVANKATNVASAELIHDAIKATLVEYRKNKHIVADEDVFYRLDNVEQEFKYLI